MNLKALKTEIFQGESFWQYEVWQKRQQRKAWFQDFGARSDSTPMAPPILLKRLLKRRRGDACRWQAVIADRVEDETMLCV